MEPETDTKDMPAYREAAERVLTLVDAAVADERALTRQLVLATLGDDENASVERLASSLIADADPD